MSKLSKLKSVLIHFPLEGYVIVALLMSGAAWAAHSNHSFWGGVACGGYLFPRWIEEADPKVRRGLETAAEQKEAYTRAASHVGFEKPTSHPIGQSAATLCNQPTGSN